MVSGSIGRANEVSGCCRSASRCGAGGGGVLLIAAFVSGSTARGDGCALSAVCDVAGAETLRSAWVPRGCDCCSVWRGGTLESADPKNDVVDVVFGDSPGGAVCGECAAFLN